MAAFPTCLVLGNLPRPVELEMLWVNFRSLIGDEFSCRFFGHLDLPLMTTLSILPQGTGTLIVCRPIIPEMLIIAGFGAYVALHVFTPWLRACHFVAAFFFNEGSFACDLSVGSLQILMGVHTLVARAYYGR